MENHDQIISKRNFKILSEKYDSHNARGDCRDS